MKLFFATVIFAFSFHVQASSFPRVDQAIKDYDTKIQEMKNSFNAITQNPNDKTWVKAKIQHMYDIDQYTRKSYSIPFDHNYSKDEAKEFKDTMVARNNVIDSNNTQDLKDLLTIYRWFSISEFDEKTDSNAWILVQHADLAPDFQKTVLRILEPLVLVGETSPQNYAYLYDRVAASWADTTKQSLQRYGTQGSCKGPQVWEPIPMENPAQLDRRRKAVGLEPMADYLNRAKPHCH